jgi:hypothetical protein
MKKQLLPALFILSLLSFLFACKKEKGDTPAQKTKTELITKAAWKFSSATASGVDVSSIVQACQKDNLITFVSNGNGSIDEGASKCSPGDPQTNPFTWNFASSETMLHVSTPLFSGGSNDFTIVTLSETQLVGSQVVSPYGTIVVTFVH